MSYDQKAFAIFAINQFGKGQHPVASMASINCFTAPYVVACLRKMAKNKNVKSDARNTALIYAAQLATEHRLEKYL